MSEQTTEVLDTITYTTRRPTVLALERLLYNPIPILDHGFVYPTDYMGDDAAICRSARVSYGRGTRKVSEDTSLIRYMFRHEHQSPFEMCVIQFHVKLPIFVARQWIRHRASAFNEYSARYSILDKEFYIPEPAQLAAQSTSNRQGRGDVLQGDEATEVLDLLRDDANRNYEHYTQMLNDPSDPNYNPEHDGLARELARMNLTLNTYTQWYWRIDLRNLFHFLGLRADAHAQYEIRVYAEKILEIVQAWVPIAAQAFYDYQHQAATFSRMELNILRDVFAKTNAWETFVQSHGVLAGQQAALTQHYGLSKREMDEFLTRIQSPLVELDPG